MPISTDVIRNLTIRANTAGFDQAKAALEGMVSAQNRVAESAGIMAVATDTSSKKTISASAALERMARSADPVYAAQQKLIVQQAQLQRAIDQGQSSTRAFQIAQASFAQGVRALTAAEEGGTKAAIASGAAHHAHAAGMGQSMMAAAELQHVIRSLGDEMAAGVPLTRALTLESGRLFEIMSSGGLGGALSAVTSKIAAFANPFTLGVGVVAGLGAAALVAADHIATLRSEMDRAVSGVGAFAGLSGRGLEDLAHSQGGAAGLSRGASEDVAGSLAATGRLDAGNIGRVIGLTRGYAGAYGTSTSDAGKALGDIFKDPLKGLDTLNERFGFLDAGTRSYVETLERQGRTQEAVRVAIDAASTSLNTMAAPQGPLDKLSSWWSKRNAEVEHGIAGAAGMLPADPMDAYRKVAAGMGSRDWMGRRETDPGGLAANFAEDTRNRAMLRGSSPLMLSPGADIAAGRASLDASTVAGRVAPEAGALRDLTADRDKLKDALGNSDVVRRLGDQAGVAFAALDKLNVGISTYATVAEKTRQQTAFSVALIGADDVATRTLIETQKAYATTLQATKDATQAAAEAERVRAEAVANAQKRLDEAERGALDSAKLIGLNPYQRIMEEGRQAIEALKRDSVIPAGPAVPSGSRPAAGVPLGGGFDSAVNRTLGFEGGRLERDTNGTPSVFGINAANNPGVDLSTLTTDGAKDIYRRKYWDPLNLGGATPGLQRVAFDTSVMEGPGQANKFIKQSGGDADQFMDLRQQFEAGLLAKNPSKYGPFATSWANRDASLRLDLGKSGTMDGTAPGAAGTDPKAAIGAQSALTNQQAGELFAAPFRDAQQQLAQMQRSQTELAGGFGLSADKVAGINERLKLENDLIRAGATSLAPYGPQLDSVQSRFQAITKAADDLKKHNDDLVRTMDDVRGAATGMLDPLIQAGLHGTSVMAALHSGLESVASLMTKRLEGSLVDSLFGPSGTTGAGSPLGGPLLGMLGGGTPAAGVGGGLASLFGGLFGGGAPGVPLGQGGIGHMATGGMIYGPGHGTSDSVPIMASNGEFIVNAAATRANANLLHAINSTGSGIPRYADGGMIGGSSGGGGGGGDGTGGDLHVHVYGGSGDDHIRMLVSQGVQHGISQNNRALPGMLASRKQRMG